MPTTRFVLLAGTVLLLALGAFLATNALSVTNSANASPATSGGDPVRGQYIFALSGGCGCHGANLAGFNPAGPPFGEMLAGPFGSVPAANITQDKDTGIGNWTDDQIVNALRNGIDDGGEQLFPIMPYNTFHFMSDADVTDLVAFLRTVPAVSNKVPERQLNGLVPPPPPLPPSPATAPTSGVDRGKYLVTAISDCGSCHTPQTPQGAPDMSKFLAGNAERLGPINLVAPNITPDQPTGIGTWTADNIATYLQQGVGPNGRLADNLMGEVINGLYGGLGFSQMTDDDAAAVASFLQSIPAVGNVPRLPPAPPAAAPDPWVAAFQAAHGRSPTDQDRADRAWSLDFAAKNGRSPSNADWIAHWLQSQH